MLQYQMVLKGRISFSLLQHRSLWGSYELWGPPNISGERLLTKSIGLAILTLKKEMRYPVILDGEKGWPLPIDFILEHNAYSASKVGLFRLKSGFSESQRE